LQYNSLKPEFLMTEPQKKLPPEEAEKLLGKEGKGETVGCGWGAVAGAVAGARFGTPLIGAAVGCYAGSNITTDEIRSTLRQWQDKLNKDINQDAQEPKIGSPLNIPPPPPPKDTRSK
jgi:hypothetical protein